MPELTEELPRPKVPLIRACPELCGAMLVFGVATADPEADSGPEVAAPVWA